MPLSMYLELLHWHSSHRSIKHFYTRARNLSPCSYTLKKLMRHSIDRQEQRLQNRCCNLYSENTHLRWIRVNVNMFFFPLLKSAFKHSLPVTKETTLGKSMKVMSLEREGIPQLSHLPQTICLAVCVSVSVCLSPSHFLCHLPLILSPLFICRLSLTHSLFPPHNTCFLTTTAKGLAGAAHP